MVTVRAWGVIHKGTGKLIHLSVTPVELDSSLRMQGMAVVKMLGVYHCEEGTPARTAEGVADEVAKE